MTIDTRSPRGPARAGQVQPREGGHARPPGEPRRTADGEQGRAPQDLRSLVRSPRFWITIVAMLVVNWLLAPLLFPQPQDRVTVPYTFFKQQVAAGNVVQITSQGEAIEGLLRQPVADPAAAPHPAAAAAAPTTYTKFATVRPAFDDPALLPLLEQRGVAITASPLEGAASPLLTLLLSFGPTVLLIGGFLWLSTRAARSAGGGMFGIGRSRGRRYEAAEVAEQITFADVAGIDEVKRELVELVDFLREPDKYQRLGGRIPKGVLLVGAPGTGKTLLARAVAGEAAVPFFSMSGSEFIEMIVGVGAARVRDLFAEARKAAPAIIFVDELDAIGRRRGAGAALGGSDEREQTLNQLLIEMDGFDSREAVIVLAATNRADVLDPALLRPGRFDRRVFVQPPDRAGRAAILAVHTRGVPLTPETDLGAVAAETPGLVGADLRNLVNEAALLAAREGKSAVDAADFAAALEKIVLGAERKLALSPADRERVAYHESGHALLGMLQPDGDPVRRVTVVARGQALGVTVSVPDDDRYSYGEPALRARIVSSLGGRAAEQLVYGAVTTGAENDIKQVTELARAMVTRWGMSAEVGLLALGDDDGQFPEFGPAGRALRPYSEETARSVDRATRRIVDECYAAALETLTGERARLDALAAALLREESLDEAQMRAAAGLAARPAHGRARITQL